MNDLNAEVIKFDGNDDDCTFHIHSNETKIISSQGLHEKGSSRMKLKNFVDFCWEERFYKGHLIAIHISGNYIAYGFTKPDSKMGLVRVVKTATNERSLIKGFSGFIEDISFAHLYEILMLACIDQTGTVNVYLIKDDFSSQNLRVIPIIQIKGDPSYCFRDKHLVSWCQFVPEEGNSKELEYEPSYTGKILSVIRGSEVEIWHIGIASSYTAGPIYADFDLNKSFDKVLLTNLESTRIRIDLKDFDIVDVSFSPDGSTIALALSNGSIYFYQISFDAVDDYPKCVFNWHPQEIFLSLRSMLFLDNRKEIQGSIELWKYVVTLSTKNELFVWSCESWNCLQKLSFIQPFDSVNPMKLDIDGTGRYLFLSDIKNNLLYVMEVALDQQSSDKYMKIVNVSEILLQSPILNMIVVDTKVTDNNDGFLDQLNSGEINLQSKNTVINLFAIQPKSIQECQIIITCPEENNIEKSEEFTKLTQISSVFPQPPIIKIQQESIQLTKDDILEQNSFDQNDELNTCSQQQYSAMDIHNLVKEKLRLKGIELNPKNVSNNTQRPSRKKICVKQITNIPSPIQISKSRESSPSIDELQKILKDQPTSENSNEKDWWSSNNYEPNQTMDSIEKEETNCYTAEPIINGKNILSPIKKIENTSVDINNGIANQIDEIYNCLQEMNSQLKQLTKKQNKIDSQMSSCMMTQSIKKSLVVDICRSMEHNLMGMIKSSIDLSHKKIESLIDLQFKMTLKKISEIVSNSNKIDTDLFTRSLVSSLSPTLDIVLKDLFMTTVIPKFEQACCSMFKQIDVSFTERSLEYQNELKILLNDDANVNNKLEFAFDKFKNDMNTIIKQTEKTILNAQIDMQKQLSRLVSKKSSSQLESYVNDAESISRLYMMISDLLQNGDIVLAFEKALSASNLDLVLYVCENVSVPPEELFQAVSMKTPIVLSLIQQLSFDLTNNTELKHKYLEAAVGSLDYTTDPHKEHIKLVLSKMENNMEKFLQINPFNPYCRKIKMLQLAVKTMISYKI
ncbi:enhancer of mRNA-decapping protein 4 [Daktulosphaira vitifoliae]|uniref:enhancer of mRNA-decapping protein 4 n=1 Tax=Daktulosphaira vitifoliae TaxID=58002 RepID=UPI0021AA3827|nr:enhancer of mRNA-decapping protein 4 [Daktulosphaira vitifoliae]